MFLMMVSFDKCYIILLFLLTFFFQCNLLITSTSVKIGCSWKKFCTLHSLREKDSVSLEVDSEKTYMKVTVKSSGN